MNLLDVLTDLARSGRLGPAGNGASWTVVREAFGEPFDVGITKSWPRLIAYGDLELSVCSCRTVILVCLQTWRDVVEVPVGVAEVRTFPGRVPYDDLVAALDRAGCAWQRYAPLTLDGQCAVRAADSGVEFVFEILPGEEPFLNVVGTRPFPHDCPGS